MWTLNNCKKCELWKIAKIWIFKKLQKNVKSEKKYFFQKKKCENELSSLRSQICKKRLFWSAFQTLKESFCISIRIDNKAQIHASICICSSYFCILDEKSLLPSMQFFFKERSGERGGQEKPWQPMVFKNDAFFWVIQE